MENTSLESRLTPHNPRVLQLYSAPTANGLKVAVALEELVDLRAAKDGFTYEPHSVNIRAAENKHKPFSKWFPNKKIPGIRDHHGLTDQHISIFESGAILLYLSEKYGDLIPHDDVNMRMKVIQWMMYGSATVSPSFKQFGFYYKYCPHALPCNVIVSCLHKCNFMQRLCTQM